MYVGLHYPKGKVGSGNNRNIVAVVVVVVVEVVKVKTSMNDDLYSIL